MQAETSRTRAHGRPRWRVPVVAGCLLLASIVIEVGRSNPNPQPPSDVQQAPPPTDADVQLIREAVVRYQVRNLSPNDMAPAAVAKLTGYCVGFDRAGGTDPSAEFLAALKDLPLPVKTYATCLKDGMPGWVPLWIVSISSARADAVQVVGRAVQNSYVYALEKRQGVWTVTAAKLTGRS